MQVDQDAMISELEWQQKLLRREMPERLTISSLCYTLSLIWLHWPVVCTLWGLHLLLEVLMTRPRDARQAIETHWLYTALLLATGIAAMIFAALAGMIWSVETPNSKAFAVALVMGSLMHLSTVRAIHLPIGIAGLIGTAIAVLTANTLYWVKSADFAGLGLSTAACFVALAFAMTSMMSNHGLYRSMARNEKAAREADEAKGLFLARMSHELRTPLNAIIGMSQAELSAANSEAKPDAERVQRLQTLTESTRTLALMVDDISDLDAIGRGRLSLRPMILRLEPELQAITAVYATRAARMEIPFTTSTESELPEFVRLDRVRLRQCLGNLLNNALRHGAPGPIHTSFCYLDEPARGRNLQIEVRDGGPGIAEADRAAIFNAFHKGNANSAGSGLGLAISRDLARSMGGDLELLPSETGAAFRLTLPAETTAAPQTPEEAPDLAGRAVLVVDDVATNRLVAAAYLQELGARAILASSGLEALDVLAGEEVDLVLLDMNMPGLDGFATAARARQMGGRASSVPIVAMTADVLEDQIKALRAAGFDGYLPKPLLPESLAAEMTRHLA